MLSSRIGEIAALVGGKHSCRQAVKAERGLADVLGHIWQSDLPGVSVGQVELDEADASQRINGRCGRLRDVPTPRAASEQQKLLCPVAKVVPR